MRSRGKSGICAAAMVAKWHLERQRGKGKKQSKGVKHPTAPLLTRGNAPSVGFEMDLSISRYQKANYNNNKTKHEECGYKRLKTIGVSLLGGGTVREPYLGSPLRMRTLQIFS